MEQKHEKSNKGIDNVEIKDEKNVIKEHLNEVENDLNVSLKELLDLMNILEYDKTLLDRAKEETKWGLSHPDLLGELGEAIPSQSYLTRIHEDIKKTEELIGLLKERVATTTIYKTNFQEQLDELNQLENRFRNILSSLSPEQFQ